MEVVFESGPDPEQDPPPADLDAQVEPGIGPAGWRRVASLDLPRADIQGAVSFGGAIVVATSEALFGISPDPDVAAHGLTAMPSPRYELQLCIVGDLLLVVGGGAQRGRPDGRVLGFQLSTRLWSERAPMPVPRLRPAVAVARGNVHAIGGRTTSILHRLRGEHHVYDPQGDRWREAESLPTPRSGAAALSLDDGLHVVGGFGAGRTPRPRPTHDVFDLQTGTWRTEPELPNAWAVVGSCAHEGRDLVLFSDPEGKEPQSALVFDPSSQAWGAISGLPEILTQPVLAGDDPHVYVIGTGEDGVVALYALA